MFFLLRCNATDRRSSINNCPYRSWVGSYNNLRACSPNSSTFIIRASIDGVGQTTGQRCCIRTSLNPTFNLNLDSARTFWSHHRSRPSGGSIPSGYPNRSSRRAHCTKFSTRLNDTFNIRCHKTALDTESLLKNFCKMQSVPSRSHHSEEVRGCGSFFKETITR